ncbi:hypothetical protein BT96DRAFT_959659 [Gymnopus androsaceus JB14]|uniref:Methyltransferase domain-containing protein n=1 Tax=Gymnopus androsaceus JB14 TaxID=1447944 RepID=A0A6A4GZQ9_9AGAR|nr:hypothetical protein BT96DRAFT_959659 [Gymnopus androsaceus JB14]
MTYSESVATSKQDPLGYNLNSTDSNLESLNFFKSQTGIKDDEELKDHIMRIQSRAYELYQYPCIRVFDFTKLTMASLPAYNRVLKLGKERNGPIFLDIGCCFGTDVRKLIADGFPLENVISSDLRSDLWDFGHDLFRSTPTSFPAKFLAGDVFDDNFITLGSDAPTYDISRSDEPKSLLGLSTLTPLKGRISAIHASKLFHLFDEEMQEELACRLAALLSPTPGSVIFGHHAGSPTKGSGADSKWARYRNANGTSDGAHDNDMFWHSPASWSEMWTRDGKIFKEGTVKVECELKPMDANDLEIHGLESFFWLFWSVTRL